MLIAIRRILRDPTPVSFRITSAGLTAVIIRARCKSKKQTGADKDENLRVEINGLRFRELPPERRVQLFNVAPAFNGSELKGLNKTIVFFTALERGEHTINLIPQPGAFVESIEIRELSGTGPINLALEEQGEDGDRRPWITFVLADLALASFSVDASARWRWRNGDDIKLVIDGIIQKNPRSLFHRNWLWNGSLIRKLHQDERQEKSFTPALSRGIHYVELWADRMPVLHGVEFDFGEGDVSSGVLSNRPRPYTYRGVKRGEDYNRFDAIIADQVSKWNHEFSDQEYPPPQPLDPNLVKAIIYIESRMGYEQSGYPDIMQVGNENDPALHALNNDGWIDSRTGEIAREYEWKDGHIQVLEVEEGARVQKPEDSVRWGVRWLYHKAQKIENGKRMWREWKEATQGYGPGTRRYRDSVWRVYQKGDAGRGIRLWSALLIPFVLSAAAFSSWMLINQGKTTVVFEDIHDSFTEYAAIAKVVDGLWFKKIFLAYHPEGMFSLDRRSPVSIQYFDLNNDSKDEIIITGLSAPSAKKFILTKKNGAFEIIRNISEWGGLNEAFWGHEIYFEDINNDDLPEVVTKYRIFYDGAPDQMWTSYYALNGDGVYQFLKIDKTDIPSTAAPGHLPTAIHSLMRE